MIPPRPAIVACAALAIVLAHKRPALWPVAVALAALAGIDCARMLRLPARIDFAFWCAWPGISAAFAWRVWRGSWSPALAFGLYAVVVPLAPVQWAAHPWAWSVARAVPHWLAPLVALVAWSGRKGEGPDAAPPPIQGRHLQACTGPCPPNPTNHGPLGPPTRGRWPEHAPSARPAQAIAAILAWSGLVDVLVGALSPSGTWDLAAPLSWATWALIAGVLLRAR